MEQLSTIEMEFSYRPSDLEHAYWVHQARSPMLWVSAALALLAFVGGGSYFYGLAASCLFAKIYRVPCAFADIGAVVLAGGSVVLGLLLWFDPLGTLIRRLNYRRNLRFYATPWHVAIGDAAISIARQASSERYEWSFFQRAVEGSREYLLEAAHAKAYLVLPKRALRSSEAESELRKLVETKLGELHHVHRTLPFFRR